MEKKYEQVVRFVQETPWAVKPEMLVTIRGVVAARMAGVELEPIAARQKPPKQNGGTVAVLPLWGVMVPHAGLMTNMSGGTALDTWIQEFRALVNDPSVSTVVLDIDSPGGSVAMVPEAAAEVRAATARKKIIAVANPEIASAAYWIASQADELVVPLSGMVGSVGVIAEHTDISQMEAAAGISRTYITAGDYKAEQLGPLSDEAKAEIQSKVDDAYNMFITDIAKGRGVSVGQVREAYGKGRMLTAKSALNAGMVDSIGTIDTVVAKALPRGSSSQVMMGESDEVDVTTFGSQHVEEYNTETSATGDNDSNAMLLVPELSWMGVTASGSSAASNVTVTSHVYGEAVEETPVVDDSEEQGTASRGAEDNTLKEGTMDERATLEELAARRDQILSRMREIHTEAQGRRFEDGEQIEFDNLETERIQIDQAVENIEERESMLAAAMGDPGRTVSGDGAAVMRKKKRGSVYTNVGAKLPDNLFDIPAYRNYASSVDDMKLLFREGARRVVENLPFETEETDKARAHADKLLSRDEKDAVFATRILATGSPLYDRAFGKLIMSKPLSNQEEAAIKAAVSHTGLGAETPVPVTIDPTVILTSDGAINPLRQLARTVTITGTTWQGISSDGVDVAYEAELTQVADQTPTFDAPVATVAKAHAYVEFSIEVDQDWGELRSNLGIMFQDAKDMKEANKFLFGTGTNEPEGLLTALVAAPASIVYTTTLNTFSDNDLYKVKAALPPRFRSSASWLANDAVYSAVRQFDTAGGASLWVQLQADRPAQLIGKPVYEASEMSDDYSVGNEEIVIYGDFGRGFIIVDRVGMNVELIPHVLGSNRRPIGARALYAYFRNTSTLLTANAFRVLTVKPT